MNKIIKLFFSIIIIILTSLFLLFGIFSLIILIERINLPYDESGVYSDGIVVIRDQGIIAWYFFTILFLLLFIIFLIIIFVLYRKKIFNLFIKYKK